MDEPRHHGSTGAILVAAAVLLLVIYPLSNGPAAFALCAWNEAYGPAPDCVTSVYATLYFPGIFAVKHGPEWLAGPILQYVNWWAAL